MLNLLTSLYISIGNGSGGVYYGFFSGLAQKAVRGGQDIITNLFWDIVDVLMTLVCSILDALINGVLGLDIFASNKFISDSFTFTKTLMFVIIPMKIVYELVSAMIRDDDAGLDVHKKLGSAFFGIMIACSLTFAVTQVINPLVKDVTTQLLGYNIVTKDKSGTTTNNAQVGDTLIQQVLIGFGGMSKDGDYGAKELVKQRTKSDFDITERYEADDDAGHLKYEYKWRYGTFTTIIGLVVYIVMLLVITVQIATRMIAIGFYYILGPLACTSLTNYQNPQAFNVWRNTILGQWAMNLSQIFLLALMTSLINSITKASGTYPLACCALYFGAFSLIISAPSFVQAMIGGYSAGVMDLYNSMRGGFGLAKSIASPAMGVLGKAGRGVINFGLSQGEKLERDSASMESSGVGTARASSGDVNKGMNVVSSNGDTGSNGGASMNDFGQEASSSRSGYSTARQAQTKRRGNANINRSSGINAQRNSGSSSANGTGNDSMNRKSGTTIPLSVTGTVNGADAMTNGSGGNVSMATNSSSSSMNRNPASSISTTSTGVGSVITPENKSNLSVGTNVSYSKPKTAMSGVTSLGNRTSTHRPVSNGVSTHRPVSNVGHTPVSPQPPKQENNNLGNRGGK